MIILSASDICKSYGTEVILENISFHINAGDRVGIVVQMAPESRLCLT